VTPGRDRARRCTRAATPSLPPAVGNRASPVDDPRRPSRGAGLSTENYLSGRAPLLWPNDLSAVISDDVALIAPQRSDGRYCLVEGVERRQRSGKEALYRITRKRLWPDGRRSRMFPDRLRDLPDSDIVETLRREVGAALKRVS